MHLSGGVGWDLGECSWKTTEDKNECATDGNYGAGDDGEIEAERAKAALCARLDLTPAPPKRYNRLMEWSDSEAGAMFRE
jgi:hypothetical protein